MDNSKINNQATTDENLEQAGYRRYRGAAVWEVGRRPWIIPENGEKFDNQEIINRCPSGALKFIK